jgi:Mn2+/Fe2+ NRAMP family transporter
MVPGFPGGFNSNIFFFLMANIGTTIAPWMIFFQQSAVVDKGMDEKDIPFGKVDTFVGSMFTVLVAGFVIILTATMLKGVPIESAEQASVAMMGINKYLGTFLAIGLFDAGFLGAICISLAGSWAFGEVFGWAHSLNNNIRQLFYRRDYGRRRGPDSGRTPGGDHALCAGDCRDAAGRHPGFFNPAFER